MTITAYRTGFCGTGHHHICPARVVSGPSRTTSCQCDCHRTPVAAGDGPRTPRPPVLDAYWGI